MFDGDSYCILSILSLSMRVGDFYIQLFKPYFQTKDQQESHKKVACSKTAAIINLFHKM